VGSSVILPSPGQPKTGPDPNFTSGSIPNIVTFSLKGLEPPSPLYIQRDDQLVIEGVSSLVGTSVIVTARLLLASAPTAGQPDTGHHDPVDAALGGNPVVTIQQVMQIPSAFTAAILTLPLAEGYLLSVTAVGGPVSASARGQLFIRLWINRGATFVGSPNAAQILVSDYVTINAPIGWPASRVLYPTEGPGNLREVTVANPAAGADWSLTVPSLTRWRIQNFNAQLVIANAGVARIIRAQLKTGAGVVMHQAAAQQTGAVNTTVQVSGSSGQITSVVDTTTLNLPLPGQVVVASGEILAVSTSNINAGDQWSNIRVLVEEWLDVT
jgi:hypothetical protein